MLVILVEHVVVSVDSDTRAGQHHGADNKDGAHDGHHHEGDYLKNIEKINYNF